MSVTKVSLKSRYIALFVVSGSIKKLYSNNSVNIYLPQSIAFGNIYIFSIFSSIGFESGSLPHIAYIDTIYAYIQHLMVISVKEYGQRFS